MKYILLKCIHWFTVYYNLVHVYGSYLVPNASKDYSAFVFRVMQSNT